MSDKKTVVIYHKNCDDGFGAAYAAWKALGDSAEYIPADYKMDFQELARQLVNKEVYVVDFSFTPEQFSGLIQPYVKNMVTLDHHKSAMDMWKKNTPDRWKKKSQEGQDSLRVTYDNSDVLFDMNKSGAYLAWEYFHPSKPVPNLIQHISDGDLWRFEKDGTKDFQMYLRSGSRTFDRWDSLASEMEMSTGSSNVYSIGAHIKSFFSKQVEDLSKSKKIKTVKIGYKDSNGKYTSSSGLCVNASLTFASDLGNVLANRCGTFAIIWETDGDTCYCSIRSTSSFNCIPLAEKYKGGGHISAAGFTMSLNEMQDLLSNQPN